uniref:Uncharacterized protein n=1 Tax=Ananas comosus var. bracteatus TaxID=296719 RepID=A0A6V7PLW8_ANACO|nr:unnamed protein product [Ananas comosus var. bracteatus]
MRILPLPTLHLLPPFLATVPAVTEVVEMSVIQLFYSKLLEKFAEKLGVETPECVVTVVAEGWFLAYIDLPIARSGIVIKIVRNWGAPSPDFKVAKEDAAHVAIQRMKGKLDLQIKNTNYDDFILYKSLYDNVTRFWIFSNSDLLRQFKNPKREYNLLKDCYASAVVEKVESIAEQVKMRRTIDECHVTINYLHADRIATVADLSEAESAS